LCNRGSKLTMLLREALGRSACLTTVVGQVSDLPVHLPEALSTIYLASRVRKAQRRPKVRTGPIYLSIYLSASFYVQ